ncbi:hypothetical protein Q3G72_026221 [Acer saccharum]|nr:hypothetical protein Q3G72_026221 [Acer saccharum]
MEDGVWKLFCNDSKCSNETAKICNSGFLSIVDPYSCINHAMIISVDILVISICLFIFIYKLSTRKIIEPSLSQKTPQKLLFSAIYNGTLALAYFGLGLSIVSKKVHEDHSVLLLHKWLVLLFQGFTWLLLVLTISFNTLQFPYNWTVKFCYLIIFYVGFLCISSLRKAILEKTVSIKMVLDMLSFPGTILLLFCAFRGHDHVDTNVVDSNYDASHETLQGEETDASNDTGSNKNVTPFTKAGFFSNVSFWWLNPLMKKGKGKILEDKDIPQLRLEDQARTCYSIFMEQMSKQKQKRPSESSSMLLVIFLCQWKAILVSGFFALIKVLTLSTGPLFLRAFIEVASGKESVKYGAYALTGGLFLVKCLESLSERQWYFRTRLIGLQIRSLLSATIYQKQLRLSNDAKMTYSPGEIVSYVTVDAHKIGELPYWFHQIWTTTLQLCVALAVVYYSVGLATTAALITVISTVVASSPMSKLQHKYQKKLMVAQDRRLKAITEALTNMKALKLYAWEIHFKNVIEGLRKEEFKWIFRVLSQKGYYLVLFYSSPIVITAVTFWASYFWKVPLNASNVFTFLASMHIAQEQIRWIPEVAGILIEAKVSFSRILKFLEAPELMNTNIRQAHSDKDMDWSIFIRSAEISWDASSSSLKATLRNISLMVKPGEKEYVMGALLGKTVVLVTHQVDFLPAFNSILLMAGGEILVAATYDKLLASTPEFQDLVNAHKNTAGSERHFDSASITKPVTSEEEIQKTNVEKEIITTPLRDQLIKKEERERGDTGLKPYLQYLRHNKGPLFFSLQAVLHMLFIIGQVIQGYWLAVNIQNSHVSRVKLISIYSGIGCVLPVLMLVRSYTIALLGCRKSESIFSTLLTSIFRAPMSFYDSTPLGRILSRVASDMSIIDIELAFKLSTAVGSNLNVCSCILILGIIAWPVLIVSIPMIYLFIFLQRYYFASAKELMRMNGTTKSSLASHLAESIAGAMTIRAFRQEDGFFSKSLKLIDANACSYFHSSSADEWLIQRLEILCAIILSSSALAMTLLPLGPSASGFIGMALSYGLSLNLNLINAAKFNCSAADFIVSVESLEQHMHIPSEAQTVVEGKQPARNWPAIGKVEIHNLKVLGKCHLREVIREKEEGLDSLDLRSLRHNMEDGFWMAFCNKSECSNETACSSGFSSIADPYSCINHASIICIDILLLSICLFFFIYKLSTRKTIAPLESQKLPLKLIYSIIYNGILGLAYFGLGILIVSKKVHEDHSVLPLHKWLVLLFQGFTWLLLALTISLNKLHLPHSRTVKFCFVIIIYVGFVCISSLRKAILENIVSIKMILDILSFPGTILLLFCAFQGHGHADTDVDNDRDDSQVILQGHGSNNKVTPFAEAGFFSNVSFWWLNPLMKKGKERILEDKDIPQLRLADQARTCYSIFMEQKGSSDSHSLLSVILLCQWKAILVSGFFALIKVLTLSASPLFLREFIKVASGKETIKFEAYVLTGGLFLAKCLESLSERQWFFRTRLIGLQVRSMLSAAIYQKQLRLSNTAKMTFSPGEIVSYITVDAYKIGEFPYWFHQMWTTCLQLCLALVIIYYSVGLATTAALITVLLTVLASSPLTKLQHKYQIKLMVAQDRRLKAITEALTNMKVLKLYAWETHFKNVIEGLRKEEFKWIYKVLTQKGYYVVLFWSSPILVPIVTLWACYFLKITLDASNAFTFLASLQIAQGQIRLIPEVAGIFIESKVSFSRIVKFLEARELENTNIRQVKSDRDMDMDWSIFIRSADISWDACSSSMATLRNINLKIKPGEKVAICGEVGSGKSTLLAAILGEVPKISGMVSVYGKIAYVSQTAWIQTGTIQENILFGSAMDPTRFQEVLDKSCLEYVLGALSAKTVLLVTHQVDFLPAFNLILLMAGGEILEAATYDKLLASTPEFQDLVNAHKNTSGSERHFEFASSTKPVTSEGEVEKINVGQQLKTPIGDQLIKKEEKEIGDTGLKPYLQYLRHKKGISCFSWQAVFLVLFVIGQLIQIYWLAADIQNSLISRVKLIAGFSLIGCILPVLLLLRSFVIVVLGCNTSESIFSTLLSSLFRAPMSFYDSTPLGRILSRVSSDMSIIDIELVFRISSTLTAYVNAYTGFVILAILAWPVLFIIIPMIYLIIYLQTYYLSSAKELMRMNGTTKSSLASYLAESIAGATTIRAFGEEDGFFSKSLKLIDENACQYFHSSSADEWLIQRLEILCTIVLSSLALVMTLLPLVPSASASGLIGMALSYGLSLNVYLIYAIENHCLAANFIVSVERLEQYMHIPSEAQTVVEGKRPAHDWPAIGKVEIYNLKVKYLPNSPLVLRGISCIIEGGHKVGIVGRTGSGKTTLINVLFRLVEPTEGEIIIDDLNITSIGLNDLRSHLAIIPQDPTLFSGSVRFNLDPLSQYTDHEIWEVLGKCHLREVIQEKEEGLDSLGELVEYDEPVKLINKEGSLFGQLVKDYLSHTTNYAQ